jgi:hypothetical protein
MAEIDDAELDVLRKGKALLDEMLRSPKTKRATERTIKQLHPETVITDDFEEPLHNEIKSVGEKLDKFLEAQSTREQDNYLAARFDALRKDGSWQDEGIEKLKKLMVERKIPDPLDAAKVYEAENPPPQPQKPSAFAGTSWGFGRKSEDVDTKLLFEDEDAFADAEAHKFFNEQAAKQ